MRDFEMEPDQAVGEEAGGSRLVGNSRHFSRYRPTVTAGLHVIASAMLLPAALFLLSWQLAPVEDQSGFQSSVYRSLLWAIPVLFVGLILAKSLKPGGLAEAHFGWPPLLTHSLLKTTTALLWLYLPCQFVYVAMESYADGKFFESLGRLAFIGAMAAIGWGFWGTARTWQALHRSQSEGGAQVLRRFGLYLLVVAPFLLVSMAVAGYFFTAVQLSWRLVWSVLVAIGIALVTGMISRLLLITQFRIKLRQLEQNTEGGDNRGDSIDITEITAQVNRLLRVTALVAVVLMAWNIWAHVIPALGYLDQFVLWTGSVAANGVSETISLRHLLVAAGLLAITYVLSSNLPGLLEITLLDRLPLDKGGRYAISFVLRYLVGVAGLLMAFQMIGFSWHSVQWLAAGLTVGLGFGLQEIFANLVSGIIILVERPVRVGDLVTVNGVTGTVSRMQLRATTIRDLDHRELIVPNKKFITEDVMNWTLSDRLSRLVFRVGIAYGSDTRLAEKTLLDTATNHPLVLVDPQPEVVFSQFGDSTLDFELRVVIPSREKFSRVIHELNMAIDAAFREQGIEIAFPQRELHIRNLDLHPAAPSPAETGWAADVPGRNRSAMASAEEPGADRDRIVIVDPPTDRKPAGTASVFKLRNIRGSEFDHSDSGGEVSMPN